VTITDEIRKAIEQLLYDERLSKAALAKDLGLSGGSGITKWLDGSGLRMRIGTWEKLYPLITKYLEGGEQSPNETWKSDIEVDNTQPPCFQERIAMALERIASAMEAQNASVTSNGNCLKIEMPMNGQR